MTQQLLMTSSGHRVPAREVRYTTPFLITPSQATIAAALVRNHTSTNTEFPYALVRFAQQVGIIVDGVGHVPTYPEYVRPIEEYSLTREIWEKPAPERTPENVMWFDQAAFIEAVRAVLGLWTQACVTLFLKVCVKLGYEPKQSEVFMALVGRVTGLLADNTLAKARVVSYMYATARLCGGALATGTVEADARLPDELRQLAIQLSKERDERSAEMGAWLVRNCSKLALWVGEMYLSLDPLYIAFAIDIVEARIVMAAINEQPNREELFGEFANDMVLATMRDVLVAARDGDFYDRRGWLRLLLASEKFAARRVLTRRLLPVLAPDKVKYVQEIQLPTLKRRHEKGVTRLTAEEDL